MNETSIILKARTLCAQGHAQEALSLLDDARKLQPSTRILIEMAHILDTLNLAPSAEAIFEHALLQNPSNEDVIVAYANHYYKLNQPAKGLAITSKAITAAHSSNALRVTHAHLLKANGEFQQAETIYKKVLENDAANCIALTSLGGIALDARDYAAALEFFNDALGHDPNNAYAETQLAYAEFRSGNLNDGWRNYAARFGNATTKGIVETRTHPYPTWNGEAIPKGKLLIWCEQAAGEELLYSTMFRDVQKLCLDGLIVECDARLKPLFERSFKGIIFVARSTSPDKTLNDPSIVAQCPAGTCGYFLRKQFSDFPQHPNPLQADTARIKILRETYQAEKIRLGKTGRIIGISWKSRPFVQGDPKSSPLTDWQSLFEGCPHLFVSLQYGDIAEERDIAHQKNWPIVFDETIQQHQSLDDFAAQVCAMDYVLSVSNTTAHMAGICNIPATIFLPAARGLMWHWFDKASVNSDTTLTTSPWYPSLRLVRQKRDGDWQSVFAEAHTLLQQL